MDSMRSSPFYVLVYGFQRLIIVGPDQFNMSASQYFFSLKELCQIRHHLNILFNMH